MRRKLTTLLFWAVMLYANAQFISFQLPIDNVMNSYQIRCVTQDKHGFIWMGTGSGLYRYDGYQYKKIQTHQQPDLLPNEAVRTISRWGSRYLWIRLRGDLYSCYADRKQATGRTNVVSSLTNITCGCTTNSMVAAM